MTAMQYVNKVVYTIPDVKDNTNKLETQKTVNKQTYMYTQGSATQRMITAV